jgi:hypothetical protein
MSLLNQSQSQSQSQSQNLAHRRSQNLAHRRNRSRCHQWLTTGYVVRDNVCKIINASGVIQDTLIQLETEFLAMIQAVNVGYVGRTSEFAFTCVSHASCT